MVCTTEAGPCGAHNLKLVINSHVAYRTPLRSCLVSLRAVGFAAYSDTIIVQGGAGHEIPPLTVSPLVLTGDDHHMLRHDDVNHVIAIRVRSNAFDYHGLAALSHYRTHPLVAADTYVYIQDTTTAGPFFVERFEAFRLRRSSKIFTSWPLPNSNIVAFGADVIHRYGHNFDGDLAKEDAFLCEFGYTLNRSGSRRTMRPLVAPQHGVVVKLGPRLPNGSVDIYGTGVPRRRFWYPLFDLTKYSMPSSATGDIQGTVRSLFGGRRWLPHERLGSHAAPARVLLGDRPACWSACRLEHVPIPHSRPLALPLCVTNATITCRHRRPTASASADGPADRAAVPMPAHRHRRPDSDRLAR